MKPVLRNLTVFVVLIVFVFGLATSVSAVNIVAYSYPTEEEIDNITRLDVRLTNPYAVQSIFDRIVLRITDENAPLYQLDNFAYEVISERIVNGILYVDINVYVYMTLTRHPRYNPFVLGLEEALIQETNGFSRAQCQAEIDMLVRNTNAIQAEIELFIRNTEKFYNDPFLTTFSYTISFPSLRVASQSTPSCYSIYLRGSSDGEIVLIPLPEISAIEDFDMSFSLGVMFAQEVVIREVQEAYFAPNAPLNVPTFIFHPTVAVNWARNNAYNPQEIPNSHVPGTNCANFVSWALHRGGIPTSPGATTGWIHSPTWGQSWPSDHWMRTGRHNNGGVTTYMANRAFFSGRHPFSHRVIPGSIMFWTGNNPNGTVRSHVALVMRNDGTRIWFADNGALQRSNAEWHSTNHSVHDRAAFYIPNPWIMGQGPQPFASQQYSQYGY